jgi:hypothetical protein
MEKKKKLRNNVNLNNRRNQTKFIDIVDQAKKKMKKQSCTYIKKKKPVFYERDFQTCLIKMT